MKVSQPLPSILACTAFQWAYANFIFERRSEEMKRAMVRAFYQVPGFSAAFQSLMMGNDGVPINCLSLGVSSEDVIKTGQHD